MPVESGDFWRPEPAVPNEPTYQSVTPSSTSTSSSPRYRTYLNNMSKWLDAVLSPSSGPTNHQDAADLLFRLPPELLDIILSHLRTIDLKHLRLTCRRLRHLSLRIRRVFLSKNQRDVDVFIAIARHEVFRHEVCEIIFDDARFPKPMGTVEALEWGFFGHITPPRVIPRWYRALLDHTVNELSQLKRDALRRPWLRARVERLETRMSVEKSHALYHRLQRQQYEVQRTGRDAEALRLGLLSFPNLRTITITPTTHGRLLRPLYETPMIRELPPSLIYPIPRGWPVEKGHDLDTWHGFGVVSRVLAQTPSTVTELIMDMNHLPIGLDCLMFDKVDDHDDYDDSDDDHDDQNDNDDDQNDHDNNQNNQNNHDDHGDDYSNFTTILSRPGFSRLDLALAVGGQDIDGWGHWSKAFRTGLLQRALAKAAGMTHFSLSTNVNPMEESETDSTSSPCIPLATFLPIAEWRDLRHFGLSRFMVKQSDVLALLHELPLTLRSVELSYFSFDKSEGDYGEFLIDMRDQLGWRARTPKERPRITVHIEEYGCGQNEGNPIDISRGGRLRLRVRGESVRHALRRPRWAGAPLAV